MNHSSKQSRYPSSWGDESAFPIYAPPVCAPLVTSTYNAQTEVLAIGNENNKQSEMRIPWTFPSVDLHALERLQINNVCSPEKYGIDRVTNIMYTQQLATSYNLLTHYYQ